MTHLMTRRETLLDLRRIDGLSTPTDQFFFIQHYNKTFLEDNAQFRRKVTIAWTYRG